MEPTLNWQKVAVQAVGRTATMVPQTKALGQPDKDTLAAQGMVPERLLRTLVVVVVGLLLLASTRPQALVGMVALAPHRLLPAWQLTTLAAAVAVAELLAVLALPEVEMVELVQTTAPTPQPTQVQVAAAVRQHQALETSLVAMVALVSL